MAITITPTMVNNPDNRNFIKFVDFIREYETSKKGEKIVYETLLGDVFIKYHNLFHSEKPSDLTYNLISEVGHYRNQYQELKKLYLDLKEQLEDLKKKNKLK